ncbi:TPA: lysozyme [Escherichia coli]
MKTSANGRKFIKAEEGIRYTLYDDATGRPIKRAVNARGNPTIGVGHLVSRKDTRYDGVTLSQGEVDALLEEDLKEAERAINNNVHVPLTQNQFDALVSLVFNVGPGTKGGKSGIITLTGGQPSTLLTLLNRHDYDGAAEQIMAWKYAAGKPILRARRMKERELFETPDA